MPSDEMVMNRDTLLMIGSSFPAAEWLPEECSARGVEVNIDGTLVCMRYRWTRTWLATRRRP